MEDEKRPQCASGACGGIPLVTTETRDGTPGRREVLAAGVGAVALMLFGRVPGYEASSALARTIARKFRPPKGSRIVGNLKHVRPNSALAIADPRTGWPAVVVRLSKKLEVKAYSAICTHAGCTVQFDPGNKLLVCPCHGSVFDPARKASVVYGPAPYPLTSLKVAVDHKENIWLVQTHACPGNRG